MSRTHRLTDPAIDDLIDVADFYDRQKTGQGDDVRLETRALLIRLAAQPFLCAVIDRPPRGRDVRQAITHRFPVLVLYEVFPAEILVLAVTHAKAHPAPGGDASARDDRRDTMSETAAPSGE